MADTSIEWTDATWNPVAGCKIVSPGCTNCYAMRMAARLESMGVDKYKKLTRCSGGRSIWSGSIRLDYSSIGVPLKWRKPRMIFVNSMSDLFHEKVPGEFVSLIWHTMEQAHWHTFQVLTKRPTRMAELVQELKVLPNVWLGTSVESAAYLSRLDDLRKTRAAVRFASFEPLLGSVADADLTAIDWAIVGGESGPRARSMQGKWVTEIQAACRRAGTAFFFKQWGGTNKAKTGRVLEGRTWDEFPATASSSGLAQSCSLA